MSIELDPGALQMADHAFIETPGTNATKVEAAIWAYLWAIENVSEKFGMEVYPSLQQLREALATRNQETPHD
jgi:hypothetical protein